MKPSGAEGKRVVVLLPAMAEMLKFARRPLGGLCGAGPLRGLVLAPRLRRVTVSPNHCQNSHSRRRSATIFSKIFPDPERIAHSNA